MTPQDDVVVVSSVSRTSNKTLDSFFKDIDHFPEEIKTHMVQLLEQHRISDFESTDIVCKDSNESPWTRDIDKSEFFYRYTYGGDQIYASQLNDDDWKTMINQLLPVLAYMQDKGYYHHDVHTSGNVLVKMQHGEKQFVVIDYDDVWRRRTSIAMSNLLMTGAQGLLSWLFELLKHDPTSIENKRHGYFQDLQKNQNILHYANSIGYRGRSLLGSILYVAKHAAYMLPMLTDSLDVNCPQQVWKVSCSRLVRSMEMLDRAQEDTSRKWKDVSENILNILFD